MKSSKRWNIAGGIALTGILLWVTNSAYAGIDALDVGYPYGNPGGSPGKSDLSIQAGSLLMSQDSVNGGYAGSVRVKVAYRKLSGHSVRIDLHSPPGLQLASTSFPAALGVCVGGRQDLACYPSVTEGQQSTFTIEYRALAAPASKTRYTEYGSIGVSINGAGGTVVDRDPSDNLARFRGKLPGTGWGTDQHPYHPASQADAVLTRAGSTTTTNNGDGTWTTNVPLTITAKTDAVHDLVTVRLTDAVANLHSMTITPSAICMSGSPSWYCEVTGGPIPQDGTRQVTAHVRTNAAPAAGSVIKLQVGEYWNGAEVSDRSPSNNVVSVTR
jgi:hypothetical protein